MRLYHPDRNHGGIILPADYAAESTKRLNEVYNVLKDHSRKFKYDQQYGRYGKQRLERPSFFTKLPRRAAIFSGHRKHYWAFALIFIVFAVAAAAGTLYLKITARQPEVSLGVPRLANTAADAGLPHKDDADDRASASVMSAPDARETGGPAGPRQDVYLAEDVYGFISRLELAFEHSDLAAYLSCYSASATENSLNYDRIREYYKNLFGRGRSRLSMGNMIISEERDGIRVRGLFAIEMPSEGRAGTALRGSYAMKLKRENGRLKIMNFRRVTDKPAAD
jgi:hypothetical protein